MIDPYSAVPAYKQLAADLRGRILSGEWASGYQLPSVETLCRTYGVSRKVAESAMAVLRGEGLIDTRQGHRARVREVPVMQQVELPPGAVVTARIVYAEELRELDVPPNTPLLIVYPAEGDPVVYPGDRYVLRAAPLAD